MKVKYSSLLVVLEAIDALLALVHVVVPGGGTSSLVVSLSEADNGRLFFVYVSNLGLSSV